MPGDTPTRATDGGNKDDSVCHWEASVAVDGDHTGIGVIAPIPYYKHYAVFLGLVPKIAFQILCSSTHHVGRVAEFLEIGLQVSHVQ